MISQEFEVSDLCKEWIIKKDPVASLEIMIKITFSEGWSQWRKLLQAFLGHVIGIGFHRGDIFYLLVSRGGKVSIRGTVCLTCLFWDIRESFDLFHCGYYYIDTSIFFSHWPQLQVVTNKNLDMNQICPHMELTRLLLNLWRSKWFVKTVFLCHYCLGGDIKTNLF